MSKNSPSTSTTYTHKPRPPRQPLPNRLVRLLSEARWLATAVALLYFVLILLSYNKADPGWSHENAVAHVANLGGRAGAWLADLLLFIFGFSAWWLCVCFTRAVWKGYRRLHTRFIVQEAEQEPEHQGETLIRWIGFVLMFAGSVGLEYLRMWSLKVELPRAAGGVLGQLIGHSAHTAFGFTGATLLLLLLFGLGFSWYFQVSWLAVAERIGESVETTWDWFRLRYEDREDRRYGEVAAHKRDEVVVHERAKYVEKHAGSPVRIETPRDDEFDEPHADAAPAPGFLAKMKAKVKARGEAKLARARAEPQIDDAQAPAAPSAWEPSFDEPDEAPVAPRAPAPVKSPLPPASAPNPSPIKIEPAMTSVPRSERAEKERQSHLFEVHGDSTLPPLALLDEAPPVQETVAIDTLEFTSRLIEKKLSDFGVEAKVVAAYPGPVVTRYEIEPATGVKGSQIVNLARDLARSLSLTSIRVVETIPGKNYMALELPNPKRQIVRLTEILGSKVYGDSASSLTVALGKDIAGKPVVADLAKMPHLLVAGTTGSGKSVGINATILSLLYKADPADVRLILIDPKMLEMSVYEGIPHLLAPVVTDMRQAGHALNWAVNEMERRYKLMSKLGVRNLAGYNGKIAEAAKREEHIPNPFSLTPDAPEPLDKLPTIVIIIDELADLMMVVGKKVEELIARIAQKARAAGIHLILATQRPSVDVITGLIKANIPTRIAFQVSSKIDSRTILDQMGAETLLGMGDMLYMPPGTGLPVRVHGAFVSDDEVHRVVKHLQSTGEPNYIEGILEGGVAEDGSGGGADGVPAGEGGGESDAMYDQAVAVVLKNRRASISLVQRHLRIGYNRAARLLEQMEQSGIVSPMQSNGNRDILVPATNAE
ncbi:DNA translocase FtsK 4TM domain-containing protein [Telluria mixta]|uniref:DNA translocase FtsK 4TM domain-containing protein n=1 Tax=Telluria mixta TaxID=34071 RepID=A0ABT2C845_9BURK|nr:DNA translocase FtsK [Telluria mixta]MCS0633573.1 DNA translocase FtsK 4TM domain-containing protein [Telluria mixta]WEM95961.1 DNA translocase FtsK 4TM domain-containing protein [Telluria mixta]